MHLLLAQDFTAEDTAALAAFLGIVLIMLLVGLAISVVICLILYNCFKSIPQQHRKMEPAMVWLLLIPLFNLVWNFFVFLRLPESYKSYFNSIGRGDVGDAGRGIGLAYAICAACSLIPCVNYLAGPASLVLLIIFLVKAWNLRSQIVAGPTTQPPVVSG